MPSTNRPVCLAIQQVRQQDRIGPEASLEASARCGCRYCEAICEARPKLDLFDGVRVVLYETSLIAGYYVLNNGDQELVAERHFFTLRSKPPGIDNNEFPNDGTEGDDSVLPLSRNLFSNTGSRQSVDAIRGWLDTCLTTHTRLCSTSTTAEGITILPDRVVEVSLDTTRQIRLIHTEKRRGRYACLSHCWGDQQPLQTTLDPDTLSIHLQHIEENHLPRTFQDAIRLIIELGIQYIWIDSLCIVQDDEKDWQVQSAQMADIYANSTITLAASASPGPHGGLFQDADPKCIGRPISDINAIHMRRSLWHSFQSLPLLQRGWVFQERVLSPRIIHFAEQELIWECMEHKDCTCGEMATDPLKGRQVWLVSKNLCHPTRWRLLKHDHVNITNAWLDIVRDYSQLVLSRPTDVFPAISGITKSFRDATGWEYVAGMWKETITQSLSWYACYPGIRHKPWRAPTFSWASIRFNGSSSMGVSHHHWREVDTSATVIEVKCPPKGADPTGQLESGYIILSGTVIQAAVEPGDNYMRGEIVYDLWTLPSPGRTANRFEFWVDFDFQQAGHGAGACETVFILELLREKGHDKIWVAYLVLLKRKSEYWECNGTVGDCEFERIGLLMVQSDKAKPHPGTFEEASPEQAIQHNAVVKII